MRSLKFRKTRSARFLSVVILLAMLSPAGAAPVVIPDVPAYYWYHGCTPTSMAMVLGYWDIKGYSNLFSAQGNDLYLTANVQDEISSPAHNAKYDPTPDDPNLPVPEQTSIADWAKTSADPYSFGATYIFDTDDAFTGYAAYKGYTFQSSNFRFTSAWDTLVNEVSLDRPVVLHVDTNMDGNFDHTVAAFGYEDRGIGGKWFASYDTWSENEVPIWKEFQGLAPGINGVWGGAKVIPNPLPEPTAIALMALAFPAILRRCRKTANTR